MGLDCTVGVVFELPSDDIVFIGPWGLQDENLTRIFVGDFQCFLSACLKEIQSKWSEPINAYDFLLGELWDYVDIKETIRAGRVIHYFQELAVEVIALETGLSIGDKLEFQGATTKAFAVIEEMQEDKEPVRTSFEGDVVAIKVPKRVRKNDIAYKIIYEWANPWKDMNHMHYSFISSGFEVRVPHAASPDQILGHQLFESKKQLEESWYKEGIY